MNYAELKIFLTRVNALNERPSHEAVVELLRGAGVETSKIPTAAVGEPLSLVFVTPGRQADLVAVFAIPSAAVTPLEIEDLTLADGLYYSDLAECKSVAQFAAASRILARTGFYDAADWEEMYDDFAGDAGDEAEKIPTPDSMKLLFRVWSEPYFVWSSSAGMLHPERLSGPVSRWFQLRHD